MSDQNDRPYPSRRQLREQGWTTGSIEALTDTGSIRISDVDHHQPEEAPAAPELTPEQLASLPAPRTRRERREQERLIATGAIPVVTASEQSSPESAAPAAPATPVPQESLAETVGGTEPQASGAPAQRSAVEEGNWRLLTRRERREMEKRGEAVPETGWIPIIRDEPAAEEPADIPPADPGEPEDLDEVAAQEVAHTPRATTSSYTVQAAQFSVALEVRDEDEQDEDQQDEQSPSEPRDVSPAPLPPVFQTPPSAGDAPTAPAQEVGVGTDTAHALILPVAPSTDLTGPMGQTGEVIVTGNIDLPRYVSERALTAENDFAEDFSDFEAVETESFTAPVRATDAVSTRTSQIEQPMIRTPRWGAASIALGASAALLGITAVGLLALALLTDIIELPF